jgi:hypothetical protein
MRNGICPKCGHNDVRTGRQLHLVDIGAYSNQSPTMQALLSTENMRVFYDVFVCVTCGYVEFALMYQDDLQKIRERWPRVAPGSS